MSMLPAGLDIVPMGPDTLLITWPQEPTPGLARLLGALAERGRTIEGVRDAWPGLRELALQYDPNRWNFADLANHCLDIGEQAAEEVQHNGASKRHELPVVYNGDDLEAVAQACHLTTEAVIAKHTAPTYTVGLIGFLPHFPYLLGLDPSLVLPRRASPRKRVAAGAVAIADTFSGVYPKKSPGGWHLLGSTDPSMLTAIQAGDEVSFHVAARG